VPIFHFHHEWALPGDPERVFDALADVERYAAWMMRSGRAGLADHLAQRPWAGPRQDP
jgi:uncharacterized protein YndB with AHSA1/START domain